MPSTGRDFGVPIATCTLSFSLRLQGADNLVREIALIILGVLIQVCNCEAIVSDSVLSTLTQPDCRSATYSIYHNMNDETGFMTTPLPMHTHACLHPSARPWNSVALNLKQRTRQERDISDIPKNGPLATPPSMAGRFYDHDIYMLTVDSPRRLALLSIVDHVLLNLWNLPLKAYIYISG